MYRNQCNYVVPCTWVKVPLEEYRNHPHLSWLDLPAQ